MCEFLAPLVERHFARFADHNVAYTTMRQMMIELICTWWDKEDASDRCLDINAFVQIGDVSALITIIKSSHLKQLRTYAENCVREVKNENAACLIINSLLRKDSTIIEVLRKSNNGVIKKVVERPFEYNIDEPLDEKHKPYVELLIGCIRDVATQEDLYNIVENSSTKLLIDMILPHVFEQHMIDHIAEHNRFADIRLYALDKVASDDLYYRICNEDEDNAVCEKAFKKISNTNYINYIAEHNRFADVRLSALDKVESEDVCFRICQNDRNPDICEKAFKKITKEEYLILSTLYNPYPTIRRMAIKKLFDKLPNREFEELLLKVICNDTDSEILELALSKAREELVIVAAILKKKGTYETRLLKMEYVNGNHNLFDILKQNFLNEIGLAALIRLNDTGMIVDFANSIMEVGKDNISHRMWLMIIAKIQDVDVLVKIHHYISNLNQGAVIDDRSNMLKALKLLPLCRAWDEDKAAKIIRDSGNNHLIQLFAFLNIQDKIFRQTLPLRVVDRNYRIIVYDLIQVIPQGFQGELHLIANNDRFPDIAIATRVNNAEDAKRYLSYFQSAAYNNYFYYLNALVICVLMRLLHEDDLALIASNRDINFFVRMVALMRIENEEMVKSICSCIAQLDDNWIEYSLRAD